MTKHATTLTCPLCSQPIYGARNRPQPEGSLGKVFVDTLTDIESWAEGDVLADDGHLLHGDDLARYLANELAPPLMRLYMKKLGEQRRGYANLKRRIDSETADVRIVQAGGAIKGVRRGAPRKDTCKRGHALTPENRNKHGQCWQCVRAREAARVRIRTRTKRGGA